jgi:RHS repeat-associated protein
LCSSELVEQFFYHPDHLGSTGYVTDYQGMEFEHMEYTPYGESWIDEGSNKHIISHRFTSQELDEETGLYYFGARYLDPKTSRWLSVDPLGAGLMNPNRKGFSMIESMNWYSYCSNNPVNYVDPSGKDNIFAQYRSFFTEREREELREHRLSPARIAYISKRALDQAYKVGAQQGWASGEAHQGRIDAFRHAYWNALLAKAFGVENAAFVTDLHEEEHPNAQLEMQMDLNNNQFGRDIVEEDPKISNEEIQQKILDEIESGTEILYFEDYQEGSSAENLTTGAAGTHLNSPRPTQLDSSPEF